MKYALNNGIINMRDIAEDIDAMERREILEKHPYNIWQSKDGKFRTHVKDTTKKEGRRLIARTTRESLEQAIVEDYRLTHEQRTKIYQVYEDWIEHARATDDLSLNTIDRYRNDFEKFYKDTDFAKRDIQTITDADILQFLKDTVINRADGEKLTQKCYTNIKTVLHGIFTYARSETDYKCISSRDAIKNFKISDRHFKYTIQKDSEQVYTDDELNKLVDHIVKNYLNRRYRGTRELGILFTVLTGIRVGELSTLMPADEDMGKLYIQRTASKGRDEHNQLIHFVKDYPKTPESMNGIELTDSALEVWNWIKKQNFLNGIQSEYVFYEEKVGRLRVCHFERTLRRLTKEVNIPYKSIHKLRKTYSSLLFEADVDKKTVQSQMRHKSLSTTEKHYIFSMRNRNFKRAQLNNADVINIKQREKVLMQQAL